MFTHSYVFNRKKMTICKHVYICKLKKYLMIYNQLIIFGENSGNKDLSIEIRFFSQKIYQIYFIYILCKSIVKQI